MDFTDPKVKYASLGIIAALTIAFVTSMGYLKGCIQGDPIPAASPSPVVSVSPSPSPSPSPSVAPAVALSIMIGETDGFDVVASDTNFQLPGVTTQIQEVTQVQTVIPSYAGARVGSYGDALMPASSVTLGHKYWIDFTGVTPGVYAGTVLGQPVTVKVVSTAFAWPIPFYSELTLAQIGAAYGLADTGTNYAQRVSLTEQYAALLRAHGIEPIKQGVSVYPDTTFSAMNFKDLVLTGTIAPPCLFGPAPNLAPSTALLQAIEAAIQAGTLPKNAWVYSWDEGEGNTTDTANALARVTLIRQYAPSLTQMITRRPDSTFGKVIFTPVMNLFAGWGSTPPGWMYVSCMSQGNCTNQASASTVAPATTFPMMTLDAPETDPERFVTQAYALGATGLLYYDTTLMTPTALNSGGQYASGGNGDGTLLYPKLGISRRLKFIRRGLADVAWKKAGLTR